MPKNENRKRDTKGIESASSTVDGFIPGNIPKDASSHTEEKNVTAVSIKSDGDFQARIQDLRKELEFLEKRRELKIITVENYDKYFNYIQQQITLTNYQYQQFLQEEDSKNFQERTEEIKNWIFSVDSVGFMGIIEKYFEKNNYKFLKIPQELQEKGYRVADYNQKEVKVQQIIGNRIFIQGLHYFNKLVGPETMKEFFGTADRFGVDYCYIVTSSDFSKQAKTAFISYQTVKGECWNLGDFVSRYFMSFY